LLHFKLGDFDFKWSPCCGHFGSKRYTWLFCADVKHVQVRTFFGARAKMLLAVETAPDLQTGLLPKYHALVPLSCAHRARIVRAFKAPQGLY
jgi:anaerobic glycerol-3-phosphate dehydrogenase